MYFTYKIYIQPHIYKNTHRSAAGAAAHTASELNMQEIAVFHNMVNFPQ